MSNLRKIEQAFENSNNQADAERYLIDKFNIDVDEGDLDRIDMVVWHECCAEQKTRNESQ